MTTLADVLGRYKPATASVDICLSLAHQPRWAELQQRVADLTKSLDFAPDDETQARLTEATDERDALFDELDIQTFQFVAISHDVYELLRTANDLSTNEGRSEFQLGLVLEALTEPAADEDQLRDFRKTVSPTVWAEVVACAERVAATPARIDLGKVG